MIEGVKLIPLRIIRDERGSVMHMLREDDRHFDRFGETYFSQINAGVFKGWHKHTKMTLNYACAAGRVKVFLLQEIVDISTDIGMRYEVDSCWLSPNREEEYRLLTIPPGVWNGFMADPDSDSPAIIANCATLPHDPREIIRKKPGDFPLRILNSEEYEIAG